MDTHEVKYAFELISNGVANGITTNPSLIKKINSESTDYYYSFNYFIQEILNHSAIFEDKVKNCEIERPIIHVEPIGSTKDEILISTKKIIDILMNYKLEKINELFKISIKIPTTKEALELIKKIKRISMPINVLINSTLCFSPMQAFMAAKHGADFISLFVGRLDDIGTNSEKTINQIVTIFKKSNLTAKLLVASIRNVKHCESAAEAGAHCITAQPSIIKELYNHPLTSIGVEIFNSNWTANN